MDSRDTPGSALPAGSTAAGPAASTAALPAPSEAHNGLRRTLAARHLMMIAMGGAIGTGLFVA